MSVLNKPHAAVPIARMSTDEFGNTVLRVTNEWFEYFSSQEQQINVTLISTINNSTQITGGAAYALEAQFEKLQKQVKAMRSLVNLEPPKDYTKDIKRLEAQIAQLQAQFQKDHTKELQNIQAILAGLLREPEDYLKNIKRNEQLNAQLLATRQ